MKPLSRTYVLVRQGRERIRARSPHWAGGVDSPPNLTLALGPADQGKCREGKMNSSLYNADRMTHLKIVVVGLLAATLVAGIGITAHLADDPGTTSARIQASGPALKATRNSIV